MTKERIKFIIKIILSVILGVVVSFAAFTLFVRHYYIPVLDEIFMLAFPVSWILFLVLWNIKKSRLVYLLLIVPILFFVQTAVIEIINAYEWHVHNIPRMSEQTRDLYDYHSYMSGKWRGAKLDEESKFKINNNFPILDGATAFFPLYGSFVSAVHPTGWYNYLNHEDSIVLCSGTPNAYNNLLERKVDLIFCFEPSEDQAEQFDKKGLKLNLIPIGWEAFVFFVNKENRVNNLTIEEIQGIYSGRIKNWRKVGGKFQNIRAFQRPENSGSQTILKKIMGGIPIVKPKWEVTSSFMHEMIYDVAAYRNFGSAIGYSFLFYSTEMIKNDQIKLLSINGIPPSRETIQDYPFSQNIYAIYIDDKNKNENIEPFIKWILSEQGQELVSKAGYIPIGSTYQ